jgi:adenosylhomocysteinase
MASDRARRAGGAPARATRARATARASAAGGQARIEWAGGQMPVLRSIADRFAATRPLAGVRVGACLHVTAETANLVHALADGGAAVALCAANPLSTQDEVAAALGSRADVAVHAARGDYATHLRAVAATEPGLVLDDGADLVAAVGEAGTRPLGAMEETTTGLVRLRRMAAAGRLPFPVLAVNEARTERALNDRHGTGQSAIDGILRATNLLLAGQTLVVLGYGWAGKGIATRARGAGAAVVVCEVDPLSALEARMEGFEVMPALAAAARGDVFVTVTGAPAVLRAEHFARMKDGAVLANAGHFDVEIDLEALRGLATGPPRDVRPLVQEYDLGGRRLLLLAQGRVINLAAAEGHPAAVMDVSFSLQALCAEELVRRAGELEPGIHRVPAAIDREVARLKLAALAVEIDALTPAQQAYLDAWES